MIYLFIRANGFYPVEIKDDGSIHLWTHWRYAKPTPQPPKATR